MNLSDVQRHRITQKLGLTARDDGTSFRGFIDDELVDGACDVMDASGVLEKTAEWHKEAHKGLGGRPAALGDQRDRLVLVLMLVLFMTKQSPQLSEITDIVNNRLSPKSRTRLGLGEDNKGVSRTALYHQIRRAWKRFASVCDPYPGPTHVRLERAEVEAFLKTLDPDDTRIKMLRMQLVMNMLLEATWQLLDEKTRKEWRGNIAMDSTCLPVWGRRGHNHEDQRPGDLLSPEFHAYWHFMHDDPKIWGYSLHIAVTVPDPYRASHHPVLAIAASMDTPNKRIGSHFTSLLASVAEREHPAGYAIADRGILGHAKPEDLNRPLIKLGYKPVMDYRSDQVGRQGSQRGAVYVAGMPHCPATPQKLVDAESHYDDTQDYETYRQRVSRREMFRFRKKDGDAWHCPASGPGATAACPLKPDGPIKLGMPTLRDHVSIVGEPAADERPDCCKGGQVSLPASGTNAEKLLQPVPYRSQKWEDLYDMRTLVEGFNGFIKDGANERLAERTNRRVRGFASNALVAVVGLVASNMRKIRAFNAQGRPALMPPRKRPEKRGYTRPPAWTIYAKRKQQRRGERRKGVAPPGEPAPAVA